MDVNRRIMIRMFFLLFTILILTTLLFLTYRNYRRPSDLKSKKTRIVYFANYDNYLKQVAKNLEAKLQENPQRWQGNEGRIKQTIEMLKNGVKDTNVILIEARLALHAQFNDSNDPALVINYIDESNLVTDILLQMDVNNYLRFPLSKADFANGFKFSGANANWIFVLKCNTLEVNEIHVEKENDNYYFNLPAKVFDSVVKLQAKIVLSDKQGHSLDSIQITKINPWNPRNQ